MLPLPSALKLHNFHSGNCERNCVFVIFLFCVQARLTFEAEHLKIMRSLQLGSNYLLFVENGLWGKSLK